MDAERRTGIFIVDDAPSIRERLREFVNGIAGTVVVGDVGRMDDAIAGILATRPACVLLDYQLVGGTGVDVLHAVESRLPDTVFVVLTNHADPQYRRACMAAGADHFLDKSTEFIQLGEIIRKIAHSTNKPSPV